MKISKLNGTTPQIILSIKAYLKMKKIIAEVDKECAWHGCVTREDDVYRIDDIEIYPQIVTGATVDADEEKYPLWIMQHTDEQINTMRFQGHSHVNMSTSPSGTDLAFYEDLTKQVKDYYIFIIQNKKGEYNLRLVDKENNLLYEDLTYEIDYGVNGLDDWYKEASKLIENKTYKPLVPLVKASGKDTITTTATASGSTGNNTESAILDLESVELTIPELEEEEFTLMCSIEESIFDVMNFTNNAKLKRLYDKACVQHEKFLGIIEGWHSYKMEGDKNRAIIAFNKLVDISDEIEKQLEKEGF